MSENLWPIVQEAVNALRPHYIDKVRETMAEVGFEGSDWFMTYLAYGLNPEPLTAVSLHKILPYNNIESFPERLNQAADHGFLEDVDDYEYAITDKGRDGVDAFFTTARQNIGQVTPLSNSKMERLATLLHRVVEATIAAPEPAVKPQLLISRRTAPDSEANAAIQIDQTLTDLAYYREDAHVAAWTPQLITGQAWEALTYIWQGEINTLDALVESRERRGFDTAAYANALDDLTKRGWLQVSEGIYQLTSSGQQIRDQAEAQTDALFSVGFKALDESEKEELVSLLTQLKEGLAIPESESALA